MQSADKDTNRPLIPEKLMKQLQDLVKDKWLIRYAKKYNGMGMYINLRIIDDSKSVIKEYREMTVYDLFSTSVPDDTLEQIYKLEKKEEEYEKLKASISNIKSTMGSL